MRRNLNIKLMLWRWRLAGGFAMCGNDKNRRRDAGATKITALLDKRPQSQESGRSGSYRASDFR
jgi:hypothetical protein